MDLSNLLQTIGDACGLPGLRQRLRTSDDAIVLGVTDAAKAPVIAGLARTAAAPMFVVGPACKPGLSGGVPDLSDLADGDVRHRIDFRRVYAALLRDWLGVPPATILGGEYEPLDLI